MEYVNLGKTGLKVSRLCVGTMGFGKPNSGGIQGKTNETEAREIIKYAIEQGINFFDTANYYGLGASEEILGRALKDYANRDEVVIATKLYYPMFDGANAKGLSRKAIFQEVENSLKRLQTDYIDLYIIHRWDYTTPIEEVMEALNDLVRIGKIRYIGASSMYAWQFQKANMIAENRGWATFISMQDMINLLYREEEKEMVKMCEYDNIALTPYSPIAHGRFSRNINDFIYNSTDAQSEYVFMQDKEIIRRVQEIATQKKITPSTLALAWLLNKPYGTSPVIGASKKTYVDDALTALSISLTAEEMNYLEEPYVAHNIVAFR